MRSKVLHSPSPKLKLLAPPSEAEVGPENEMSALARNFRDRGSNQAASFIFSVAMQ
jgi:hypothetical protein